MAKLRMIGELTQGVSTGLGEPEAIFTDARTGMTVVSGVAEYGSDGWELYRRTVLFSPGRRRVAMLTGQKYELNDVAFHPTQPIVVLASGSYDGGYCFEGEVRAWNWETGSCYPLTLEQRTVLRCWFTSTNDVVIVVTPFSDDDEDADPMAIDWEAGQHTTYRIHIDGQVVLGNVAPSEHMKPAAQPSDDPGMEQTFDSRDSQCAAAEAYLEQISNGHLLTSICGMAWLDESHLAICSQDGSVELWNTTGSRIYAVETGGNELSLLETSSAGLLLNSTRTDPMSGPQRSDIIRVTMDGLEPLGSFPDCGVVLDVHMGRVYATEESWLSRGTVRSWVFEPDMGVWNTSAGPTDSMFLVVAGDDMLTSTSPLDDDELRCFERRGGGSIERWTRHPPKAQWTVTTESRTVDVKKFGVDLLLYVTTAGELGVVRASTGDVIARADCVVEGFISHVRTFATRGATVAVGTLDGRVLLWECEPG